MNCDGTGLTVGTTEETNRRLAALIASSDDAIISNLLSGIIIGRPARAERIFGCTAAEVFGEHLIAMACCDSC